jgi:hypothetical protein
MRSIADWPAWRAAVVVASGPSAHPVEEVRGRVPVIAVNCSLRLCPWADVLYACDRKWWGRYGREFRDFAGLRVAPIPVRGTRRVRCDMRAPGFVLGRPGVIGWLGNSGAQAVNLALMFGARRIALVGFDMRADAGLHWHPDHETGGPTAEKLAEWAETLDAAAVPGIVNASMGSALTAYPKMEWQEAAAWLTC